MGIRIYCTVALNAHPRCRLFPIPGASISVGSGSATSINDTAVDAIILAVDDDGDVIAELDGILMIF